MYKHLTPQEIEEFEKRFPNLNDSTEEGGYEAKGYVLSFIDTLIGKRVGEIAERVMGLPPYSEREFATAKRGLYFKLEDVLSLLSPDSPKRNDI